MLFALYVRGCVNCQGAGWMVTYGAKSICFNGKSKKQQYTKQKVQMCLKNPLYRHPPATMLLGRGQTDNWVCETIMTPFKYNSALLLQFAFLRGRQEIGWHYRFHSIWLVLQMNIVYYMMGQWIFLIPLKTIWFSDFYSIMSSSVHRINIRLGLRFHVSGERCY